VEAARAFISWRSIELTIVASPFSHGVLVHSAVLARKDISNLMANPSEYVFAKRRCARAAVRGGGRSGAY
jgi:hypothetical protein